jgi:hypothetical protein
MGPEQLKETGNAGILAQVQVVFTTGIFGAKTVVVTQNFGQPASWRWPLNKRPFMFGMLGK